MNLKKLSLAVLLTNLFTLVSAYSWGSGYYYTSPMNLLENDWVKFGAIFVLFFAIIFFAISKTFKENKGAAVAIALAVSLFISMAFAKQGLFYSYAGEELGNYLFVFAIVLGLVFILKALSSIVGGLGIFIGLAGLWYVLKNANLDLFYNVLPSNVAPVYEFFIGSSFIIWLAVVFIIIVVIAYSDTDFGKDVKRWLWGKKKKTVLEVATIEK